jgi:hypothetical protein
MQRAHFSKTGRRNITALRCLQHDFFVSGKLKAHVPQLKNSCNRLFPDETKRLAPSVWREPTLFFPHIGEHAEIS